MTVQTEDVAGLMPRLPSNKRFQRLDSGTKLMFYSYDTTEASKDHHQLRSGSSRRLVFRRCWRIHLQRHDGRGCCELCRVESPCVRFNRESSRMILICRDLRSNVLGYLPLPVMPHRFFFVFFASFFPSCHSIFRSKRQNDIFDKKSAFLIEKKGSK